MKSIVLVDPAKSSKSTYGNATALSMFVLREIAERKGHRATIVNLSKQGEDALFEIIKGEKPDIIGFTATSPAHAQTVSLARKIRAEYPQIQLIKGGIHERYGAEFSRRDPTYPFDVSFVGESDLAFARFLEGNMGGPLIRTHDVLPRDFVVSAPREDTVEPPFELLGGSRMIRLQSMRGCGFGCDYCAIKGVSRRLDPSFVIQYLRDASELGVDRIFFEDATFTIDRHRSGIGVIAAKNWDRGWTYQFSKGMQKAGLHTKLGIGVQTRIDCLDLDTAHLLVDAGVQTIYIGIESLGASVDVSKGLQGNCDTVQYIQAAIRVGLKITVSLICDLGTDKEFRQTLHVLSGLGIHEIFMEAYKLFPGAVSAKEYPEGILQAYELGIGKTGSVNSEDDNCVLKTDVGRTNERYGLADSIFHDLYRKVDEGHFIKL